MHSHSQSVGSDPLGVLGKASTVGQCDQTQGVQRRAGRTAFQVRNEKKSRQRATAPSLEGLDKNMYIYIYIHIYIYMSNICIHKRTYDIYIYIDIHM